MLILCRVSEALDEGETALGKAFAECNTQQRVTAKMLTVKAALPSAKMRVLGKGVTECHGDAR